MGSKKRKRLEATVAAVQRRWGTKALRKLVAPARRTEIPHVPTGFPALDRALGIGGIPSSRITEILGVPTSGIVTLTLRVIANAQAARYTAAYVDLGSTFDPDYAARCGVSPAGLFLVRPRSGGEALEITHDLVVSKGVGVLVFDTVSYLLAEARGARAMSAALRRLAGTLAGSPCALLFLTSLYFGDAASADNYPSGFALPHYAAVRLLVEKERWLRRRRDVRGYRAQVTVLKNKLSSAGRRATISITFNGVVDGNGT